MKDDNREEIMEKRSSLRGWHERGGKIPIRGELVGAALIGSIFLILIVSSYWNGTEGNNSSPADKQKKIPSPEKSRDINAASLPAPSIRLRTPENVTYNSGAPLLDLLVAGSKLNTVILSVDGGKNMIIPHDGSIAAANYYLLGSPTFKDDFSADASSWTSVSGKWRTEKDRYLADASDLGISVANFDINATKFSAESVINSRSEGKFANGFILFSYSNQSNFYYAGAYIGSKKLAIGGKGFSSKIDVNEDLSQNTDYKMKVNVDGGKVTLYLNEIKKLEYDFGSLPAGKAGFMVNSSTTEFDDFSLRLPFPDGSHNLTVFASNTDGNSSSKTVYFTILTNKEKAGKIGVPLIKSGFEIMINSVTAGDLQTSAWVSVKNTESTEKPFVLNPKPVIIDDKGNQYETVSVPRSAEIAQTTLYPQSTREGAIFFNKLKAGVIPRRLVLNVNGERFEFALDERN